MKTIITATAKNRVAIKYECAISGDVIETEFIAPLAGGYVRLPSGVQICEKLAPRGSTLIWSGESPLINLIRREYNSMRRAEKSYNAHYS